jgi:2-oxoglutarate ferredoxin oxidoreductase subunit delta
VTLVSAEGAGLMIKWDGDEPAIVMAPLRVVIVVERCKGCGLCVAVCPPDVLALGGLNAHGYPAAVLTDNERCTSCTACALVCPESAITVYKARRVPARKGASS